MQLLGIDIGSSSIKGAVLDLERRSIGPTVREAFPDPLPGLPQGYFEVLPAAIVVAVRQVLAKLLETAPDVEGVVFCGQMGGVLLADATGRALTNYLSWRDQRTLAPHPEGGTYLEALRRRWTGNELQEVGNELKPGSATSLLFWLAEKGQLPRGATPLTLGDFVLAQLCHSPPCTEPTQALGMLNLATGDWRHAALERLGLAGLNWPPLVEWRRAVGHFDVGSRRLPCYPVLGDQQCALRGARLEEGELSLNVSTGSQVSLLTRELRPGPYQTRPYFDGAWLNTITHLPAGRSLNALVDLLSELAAAQGVTLADPWPYIARAVADAPESELEVRLTFFAGALGETGRIDNITLDNLTVGGLFRAAFRHMADNYWNCAERLSPERRWRSLVLSGGLAQRMPALRRAILDRFQCRLRETPEGEDVLLGLLELYRAR